MNQVLDLSEFGLSLTNLLAVIEKTAAGQKIDILNADKESIVIIVNGLMLQHEIGSRLKAIEDKLK